MRVISKIVVLVVSLLFAAIEMSYAQNPNQKLAQNVEQLQKLMRVYNNLDRLYVEDVDMKPVVEEAIRGMLSELDPHSSYLTAEEMKAAMEMTKGKFGGIGVAYDTLRDSIVVTNVLPNGPAQKAGLKLNDRIVEVDGRAVVGVKRSEVPKLLRGDSGSVVEVGVARRGNPEILRFLITRDNIPVTTVDAAYKVNDKVGYVRVNRFANSTMEEFRKAMSEMSGVETLILDLSNNGGGLMHQAIDMADYFLPKGLLITSTEGRAIPTTEYLSKGNKEFAGRLIVIINESTASGGELLAGALQDWDRAIVIGRSSYGKGLVQREMPLGDGSAIRLTIARYHTPSGRVIQRPYNLGHKEDYDKAYIERLRMSAANADSLMRDSVERPRFNTLRRGRTIYGGGGIIPDVRVDVDTTQVNSFVAAVIREGVSAEFMVDYMDKYHQLLVKEYPTFKKFESDFVLADSDMAKIAEMATAKGIKYSEEEYKGALKLLRTRFTAQIAQLLFSQSEYYQYVNSRANDSFRVAMRLAENWAEEVEPVIGKNDGE